MTAFFHTFAGTLIPVSRIWSISAEPEKHVQDVGIKTYSVRLDSADGQQVSIYGYERERIAAGPRHLVPALPETYALGSVHIDYANPNEVWRNPVIAWAMTDDGVPAPVTADGISDASGGATVLLPNGTVVGDGDMWRTFDQWFAQALGDAKAKAAQDTPRNG